MPVAAAMVIAAAIVRRHGRGFRVALASGVVVGIAGASLLWGAGKHLDAQNVFRIEPQADGTVVVSRKGQAAETWHVWPDMEVLGRTPGKEIRRWMGTPGSPARIMVNMLSKGQPKSHPFFAEHLVSAVSTVRASQTRPSAPENGFGGQSDLGYSENAETGLILFGQQAERLGRDLRWGSPEIVLVHPCGRLPSDRGDPVSLRSHQITVVLPEIDQNGDQRRWRTWAEKQCARVVIASGVGQDVRAVWPKVMIQAMLEQAMGVSER